MRRVYLIVTLILFLTLTGCKASLETQATKLLGTYTLHPIQANVKVEPEPPIGFHFEIANESSKKIGLDMEPYRKSKLESLSYLLKEKSKSKGGKVYAVFLYTEEEEIVGAFLYSGNWSSLVTPLNDNSKLQVD